ncbi:MAG: MBL fold metallo-hydrolase [Marinosulfonomonas sp.]
MTSSSFEPRRAALVFALSIAASGALADVLEIQPVTDDVWALVGFSVQRDAGNLGNNATFGLVVTDAGAVLIDPGGSEAGAAMIHDAIRSITDQPVAYVMDTGGQDHRWLGNDYWQRHGATVIASAAALEDQKERLEQQLAGQHERIGAAFDGTVPAYADVTFETDYTLEIGGLSFEIMHRGPAHTVGDSFVWLDERDVVFTGDIVFVDRMLGNGPARDTDSWIAIFEAMAAFEPTHIVPGHGRATDLATATRDTHDYLVNLRTQIGALIDAGGDILDAPKIDQSAWGYLAHYDAFKGRNAQSTYEEMEWE